AYTASAAISTLSLHDALPIYRQGPQQESDVPFVGEPVEVEGYLDLRDEGYGFLRLKGFLPSKDDVYVSVKQARQFGLRKGDFLKDRKSTRLNSSHRTISYAVF